MSVAHECHSEKKKKFVWPMSAIAEKKKKKISVAHECHSRKKKKKETKIKKVGGLCVP